jgi:broad specificity phosphatase PhoE
MNIILARHGETEWNVGEIFRGRADIELNETGIKQAELLAEYLSDFKIDAIYSSPLKRASKTAEIIASHHKLKVEIAPELIDFNYGEWQGLSHRQVKDKYGELCAGWLDHPEKVKIPSGESLNHARQRAMRLVNRVTASYKGTAVMVSHRVVHKVIICALLGLTNSHFWNIRLDTCGITTFACESGRFILNEHNNTCFLRPLQKARLSDF